MDMLLGSLLNMIADGFGAMTGGLWGVSRKIRTLGGNTACPHCNAKYGAGPRIYRSSNYPVPTSWRTPSIIAEFKCPNCGKNSEFLFADSQLSRITDTREASAAATIECPK